MHGVSRNKNRNEISKRACVPAFIDEDAGNAHGMLFKMLHEASECAQHDSTVSLKLLEWFEDNLDVAGNRQLAKSIENLVESVDHNNYRRALCFSAQKKFRLAIEPFRQLLEVQLSVNSSKSMINPFIQNLEYLADELALDQIEIRILELVLNYQRNDQIESLFDALHGQKKDPSRTLAMCLGVPTQKVIDRIKSNGRLVFSGLFDLNPSADDLGRHLEICEKVLLESKFHHDSSRDFFRSILGKPAFATLTKADFDFLESTPDFLVKLITGANKERRRGVNILLYGPPGCGKTELCKTVAAAAGAELYSIGEQGDDGSELSRSGRLNSLRFAQQILSRRQNVALLFDEMEDLNPQSFLFGGPKRSGSKVHQNRLLEENFVPVLWTCNDISGFDPAF